MEPAEPFPDEQLRARAIALEAEPQLFYMAAVSVLDEFERLSSTSPEFAPTCEQVAEVCGWLLGLAMLDESCPIPHHHLGTFKRLTSAEAAFAHLHEGHNVLALRGWAVETIGPKYQTPESA